MITIPWFSIQASCSIRLWDQRGTKADMHNSQGIIHIYNSLQHCILDLKLSSQGLSSVHNYNKVCTGEYYSNVTFHN